jgi:hypothetical protein
MNPPKCRVCGVVEWNHLCSGEEPRHGDARVETRPVAPPPSIPRRKPTWPPSPPPSSSAPSAPSPSSPPSPPAPTSSDASDTPPSTATNPDTTKELIKLLRKKVAELNAEVAELKAVTKRLPPLPVTAVTKKPTVTENPIKVTPRVTKKPTIPVTPVTKKGGGRPKSGNALAAAEKQKAYRERKKSPAKIPGKSSP